ncbi:U8 snoRNA-decapping enzyme [Geodia barretti]|uniref:U8 snoRNA-decapping enzyme n=1 Tax=Geodia barretti TaxID=519541 RepID=A0AA35WBX2_GEOBA|nr:U8 snoRNA-decapping enzyme [Geodia barretti]
MLASADYVEVSESEWKALLPSYGHAAHVMVYSTWPGRFMDKYEHKFAVSMQLRFDGTLGFPGGMVDSGETPETAAGRELAEETGCHDIDVTPSNHVVTHVSKKTQLCLHLFAKKSGTTAFH